MIIKIRFHLRCETRDVALYHAYTTRGGVEYRHVIAKYKKQCM